MGHVRFLKLQQWLHSYKNSRRSKTDRVMHLKRFLLFFLARWEGSREGMPARQERAERHIPGEF